MAGNISLLHGCCLIFYMKSGTCILDLCFAIAAYEVITFGYLDLLILSETCLLCFTVIVWRVLLCKNVWYDLLVNSRYWENDFFNLSNNLWNSDINVLICFCFKILNQNKFFHLYFYINAQVYKYRWVHMAINFTSFYT